MPEPIHSNESTEWTAGDNVTLTFTDVEGEYTQVTVAASGAAGAPSDVDYLVGTASGSLSAEIVVGTSPGGELGGTWASPTVDTTHSGSSHAGAVTFENLDANADVGTGATQVAQGNHTHAGGSGHTIAEAGTPLTARATLNFGAGFDISDDAGNDETDVALDLSEVAGGGDITWTGNTPAVDNNSHTHDSTTVTTHSTAHANDHARSHDHSNASDGTTLTPATLNIPNAAAPAPTTEGQVAWDNDGNFLVVGDGAATQTFYPVVDATSDPAAVSTSAADGTEATVARKDHVHAHEAAHINHDTTWAAKGDLIAGTANDTAQVLTVGADDTILMADSGQTTGLKWSAAAAAAQIADIADSESAGTSDTWARGDHVHSGSAYRATADIVHSITFTKTGNLATGTGATRWYNDTGGNITLQSARGSVGTAPANQSILVDINNNGTSVWNATQANRITIAAAGNTDEGGAFDDATIADGEYITVDIDQVGTGTVGADLTVTIWWTAA